MRTVAIKVTRRYMVSETFLIDVEDTSDESMEKADDEARELSDNSDYKEELECYDVTSEVLDDDEE